MLFGKHGLDRDELRRCVQSLAFRRCPRRGDHHRHALRRQRADECAHVYGGPLVAEDGNAWISRQVQEPHQATASSAVPAFRRRGDRTVGIRAADASASSTCGRLAERSNCSATRSRARLASRSRSAASTISRSSPPAKPSTSHCGASSADSPSVSASPTPVPLVLTIANPRAIASRTTFGMPSRSPFSSCRQASAKMSAFAYSCSISDSLSGPRKATRSRSEEHTSELQSPCNLVCRLLLEKKQYDQYHENSHAKHWDYHKTPLIGRQPT